MSTAHYLNRLSAAEARASLERCCGSRRWVERMCEGRPYASDATLLAAAEEAWWALEPTDWLEAFRAHPRIGERGADAWSRTEQAGVATAGMDARQTIARGNQDYEARFGYLFLTCATGKSMDEILAELGRRLEHDPVSELKVAALEQSRITRLRLEKLAVS